MCKSGFVANFEGKCVTKDKCTPPTFIGSPKFDIPLIDIPLPTPPYIPITTTPVNYTGIDECTSKAYVTCE